MSDVDKSDQHISCNLSESVFSVLKQAYKTIGHQFDDKELYNVVSSVLSIPPMVSVLRVNTMKEDIVSAQQKLQKVLERQENRKFEVCLHDKVPNILIVKSCEPQHKTIACSKEVTVGEMCGIAVLRGADVFAPGVFGAPMGMKQNDMVSVYADLDAKCRRGFTQIYTGRKFFVGNGNVVLSRKELFNDTPPKGVAIKMTSSLYSLPSFDELNPDLFFGQNLPSVLVGSNLGPVKGDLILDMCAAPGGKTTHVATLIENDGIVIAIDKSKSKVQKLEKNCRQQSLTCVQCYSFDSTKLCEDDTEFLAENPKPPFPPECFDKIILDPPCSGLGQRPQFQCNTVSSVLEFFPIYQKKLFRQAVKLLKPGGILTYSTCTMTISENENQVAWALKNFPELTLIPQDIHLGISGIIGHDLDDENCKLVQRFDPCIKAIRIANVDEEMTVNGDTIGFFIAKFQKCTNKLS